jgi:hypothetical protein
VLADVFALYMRARIYARFGNSEHRERAAEWIEQRQH